MKAESFFFYLPGLILLQLITPIISKIGGLIMAFKKTRSMKVYGMSGENDIIGLSRKTIG